MMASAESDSDSATTHNRSATKYTPRPDLDPGCRWHQWVLDVADALGFIEVRQQEVTVEPVVNGGADRQAVEHPVDHVRGGLEPPPPHHTVSDHSTNSKLRSAARLRSGTHA